MQQDIIIFLHYFCKVFLRVDFIEEFIRDKIF